MFFNFTAFIRINERDAAQAHEENSLVYAQQQEEYIQLKLIWH